MYDSNAIRTLLARQGAEAVIPSVPQRNPIIPHDREAYKARNLVERFFNIPLGDAGIACRSAASNTSARWQRAMTSGTTTASPPFNSTRFYQDLVAKL